MAMQMQMMKMPRWMQRPSPKKEAICPLGNAVMHVLHWNLLAKTSESQVAHACPPASPTMQSFGPSVSFHFSYTQKKLSFLNILEFKIVSVTCGTITREGTLLWASSDRGRAIHSWALNWNIVMPLFNRQLSTDQEASAQAHPWHFGAQQPEAMPMPHLTLRADCIFFAKTCVEFPPHLWPRYIFFSFSSCCFLSPWSCWFCFISMLFPQHIVVCKKYFAKEHLFLQKTFGPFCNAQTQNNNIYETTTHHMLNATQLLSASSTAMLASGVLFCIWHCFWRVCGTVIEVPGVLFPMLHM